MKKFYKNGLRASLVAMVAMLGFSFSNADSPRFVVMEQFTNTSCGPCAAINPQYHAGLEDRDAFVLPLVYHWYYPSKQDPMYTIDITMNEERAKVYGVTGVPTASINGGARTHPANYVNASFSNFDNLKGQISPIDMAVTMDNGSATVEVSSSIDLMNHTLHVVVVEDPVDYGMTFPNGEKVFPWVPRQMLPDYNGTAINIQAGATPQSFNFNFDASRALQQGNLHVVAFVQDNSSNEILQGRADNSVEPLFVSASVENPYMKTKAGGSTIFEVTLTNSNDFPVTGNVAADVSNLPNGWSASLMSSSYSIDANSTTTVSGTITATAGTAGFIPVPITVNVDDTQGMTGTSSELNVYSLSDATESVYYFSSHDAPAMIYQSLASTPWGSKLAVMGMSDELMAAYGPENFEMAIFATDYGNRGSIGVFYADDVNAHIAAGNDVLILSNLDVYNGVNYEGGVADALALFSNLGIGSGNPISTSQQSGNQISLSPITVTGTVGSDFEGMTLNLNSYNSQSHPYYTQYVDEITITDATKNDQIFDLSVQTPQQRSAPGGIIATPGNSKVMLLPFGFELIMSPQERQQLATGIYQWFQSGQGVEGPGIASDVERLEFGTVAIGQTEEMTVTISNPGTMDLTLSDPYVFLTDGRDVFTLKDPSIFPATVAAKGTLEVTVIFAPDEANVIEDDLFFATNIEGKEEFAVGLSGKGQEASTEPSIQVSVTSLDFGKVLAETKKDMKFEVTNTGQADLVISNIVLMNEGSEFTIKDLPSGDVTVPFNNTREFTVEFMASTAGQFDNTVEMTTNDPSKGTVMVTLSAEATPNSVDEIVETGFSVKAQPNVFSGSTVLNMEVEPSISGNIDLYLIDAAGNKVMDIYSGTLTSQSITLNAESLAAGRYYVVAQNGNTQSAMHVIVE